ncbi:YheC/YheD family protein [Jeotgalibacillus salarius]|uniref:ATP-grasp domain-containing protein n=1 Tax=Jeotgalibacillus salarius TaxID=546023 RepID=A0A4Y8LPW7_9BACL|nr:YheC/YheD family protein [Jeotgalibacillus salarius]TFE04051.1 hypothetical protein E2626_01605 [Jeotgalibacillus salarius]
MVGVYNDRKHPLDILTKDRVKSYVQQAAEQGVALFFFGIDDVNVERSEVSGTFYEHGKWIEKVTSFPALVLNDSSTSPDKVKNRDKELVLRTEVPFISHLIEDKLSIYQKMKESGEFNEFLIPSTPLKNLNDVLQSKQTTMVLKPTNSGKGQGIHVLKKISANQFLIVSSNQKKQISTLLTKKLIIDLIKQGNYMVQPFIVSRTNEGNTFHMRVHVIRDKAAKWVCLTVIADVAEPGRYTSNYAGNTTIRGIDFLAQQHGQEGIKLYSELKNISFRIASHLDSFYPFTVDELALDFAIDQDRRIYLFEANTGPEIISFAKERENERAFHRVGYAKTVAAALEKIPFEQRRGKHFKLGADQQPMTND